MISLHMINDANIVVNSDLIEFIEATPDTVISLSTGKKFIVKESVPDVVDKVVEFRRSLAKPPIALIRSVEPNDDIEVNGRNF